MAASVGATALTATAGVAADTGYFTQVGKQLAITNYHATQTLTIKVVSGLTSAQAAANAVLAVAVVGASDTFTVPPGRRTVCGKSARPLYWAFNHIGSGAATTFTAENTMFRD